ncbi:hypothetical protein D3C81_1068090 [compost metagenome]
MLALKEIAVLLFLLPDFVVINTTPLAALEPYTAAEEASFSTVTLSISFTFTRFILTSGIPSTTISGPALLTVPNPRIKRSAALFPAIPEF